MRWSTPTPFGARTSSTVDTFDSLVVEPHRRRPGLGRLRAPAPPVRPGPLGQAGLDGELPGERPAEVGDDGLPVDAAPRRQHAELRRRHHRTAQLAGVGPRRQHVEAAQRQHAGHAGEGAGHVVADDRDALGARLAGRASVGLDAHVDAPGRHRRQRPRVREAAVRVGARLTALQGVRRAGDEVGDELLLPRAPRRGPGGQRVGLGEGVQQVERADVDRRRRRPAGSWPDRPGRAAPPPPAAGGGARRGARASPRRRRRRPSAGRPR